MYRAESFVMLSLGKIKSANVHLVLREQILTEVKVGQDMRALTEWQGWRILVSGGNEMMLFLSRYAPKYVVEVMLLGLIGSRADEQRRTEAGGGCGRRLNRLRKSVIPRRRGSCEMRAGNEEPQKTRMNNSEDFTRWTKEQKT
jgi:hypothetical protein